MHVSLGDAAPRTNHYSLLHLREEGKWLIGEIHESPSGAENLSELSWLIGDWSAQQEDTELSIKYDWFGAKAFVRGIFTVKFKDRRAGSHLSSLARNSLWYVATLMAGETKWTPSTQ